MSLINQVTRALRAETRKTCAQSADLPSSLTRLEDELDLCCTLVRGEPARAFIRRRLGTMVRLINGAPGMVSAVPACPSTANWVRSGGSSVPC